MVRKPPIPQVHPDVVSDRVGLMVVDIQTLHRGHVFSLLHMRMTCGAGIVGIGSVKQHGIEGHPFTFEQRAEMVRAIFGDAFRFVPLDDIDATADKREWYDYVSGKVAGASLPKPTDYFCGSLGDAAWYVHAFADPARHPSVAQGPVTTWTDPVAGRRLHVVDRSLQGVPSGRDIRLMIEFRDPAWKLHVPELLHRFVEQQYPPHLRQPIDVASILNSPETSPEGEDAFGNRTLKDAMEESRQGPAGSRPLVDLLMQAARENGFDVPVGTRITDASGLVLELKDDARWRPLRGRDEKSAYSAEMRALRMGS